MGCFSNCGGNSCWIIILLLLFCGNTNTACGSGCGNGGFFFGNDCSCIWIILLLLFCGNGNSGCVTDTNIGCGCNPCNPCNTCC